MASITSTVPAASNRPVTCFEPPSLGSVRPLTELARLRFFSDLLMTLSAHRINVRYKHSRLGILWAILQPLALMLVFSVMFSFVGGAPIGGVPYSVFVYAGLLLWTTFSTGLSSTCGALTSHGSLLTKASFPREILPITYVVAALVDLAIGATVLAALMFWYRVPLTATSFWAIPAIALLAVFLIAMGLLVSALQVRHRDVGLAIPVILQIWMFATPVLYPLSAARHALPPALYLIYVLNPMAGAIEAFRQGVVLHAQPDAVALAAGAAAAVALLPIAYMYFKLSERTMADVV